MSFLALEKRSSGDSAAFKKIFYWIAVLGLLGVLSVSTASEENGSILESSGFLSRLAPGSADVRRFDLVPPVAGAAYEVKVNFLKAETFGSLIDDYYETLRNEEHPRGEDGGLAAWRSVKGHLQGVTSRADFQVFDADGKLVKKVTDIGSLTWGRTVKLTADSPAYKVEIRCVRGAGLFHLSFEHD